MTLIFTHYTISVNESLHKFQKRIFEVRWENQPYQMVSVGFYKNSTGTLDYPKTILTKLLHYSKRIYTFTKFQKRNMKRLGNYIDEVSNPHLSLFYLKLKKSLNVVVWTFPHSRFITLGSVCFE